MKRMKWFNRKSSRDALLGISVTQKTIEAVLFRTTENRVEIIRRFTRQRLDPRDPSSSSDLSSTIPDLRDDEESDVTFELGGHSSSRTDFDLDQELSDFDSGDESNDSAGSRMGSRPFSRQLRDIVNECITAGYRDLAIAFSIGAPDVTFLDVSLPPGREAPTDSATPDQYSPEVDSSLRRRLLKLLSEKHSESFEEERVEFLPMTRKQDRNRYLALIPVSNDSITTTLQLSRRQDGFQVPPVRRVDTEISVYLALARSTVAPEPETITAVIRVGANDTLILFLKGRQLEHVERLRSLTSFDSPDTVCSRVLLQQDEQKIGSVDHVLLLGGDRNERMLESFRRFFSEAAVVPLQELLLEHLPQLTNQTDGRLTADSTAAIGSALQLLDKGRCPIERTDVDLLSSTLRAKRRPRIAAGWHTYLMMTLLFLVTLGAAWHYMNRQFALDREQEELRLHPPQMPDTDPDRLEQRVDSLNQAYRTYTRALDVLDSLLVGSDRWSQTLEKVARTTDEISGTWLKSWKPEGEEHIRLEGNALSRSRVVSVARRLNGRIEKLQFAEIREHRIYPFTMVIPLPHETPEVASYLQTRIGDTLRAGLDSTRVAANPPELLHEHRDGTLH